MRYRKLFALMALGVLAVAANPAAAQTAVRVGVTFDNSTRGDSATLRSALVSGIEDGGSLRVSEAVAGARYLVNANFTTRGAKVFVDMRVLDAVTGNVVSRTTTSAPPAEVAGATTTLARGVPAKVAK